MGLKSITTLYAEMVWKGGGRIAPSLPLEQCVR